MSERTHGWNWIALIGRVLEVCAFDGGTTKTTALSMAMSANELISDAANICMSCFVNSQEKLTALSKKSFGESDMHAVVLIHDWMLRGVEGAGGARTGFSIMEVNLTGGTGLGA
mmetsp:Transcript_16775/g.40114  ORF Transcript_16775/g.40114 Transcript_16775/m.40114 type:complete len:114 (-) Transcript_16775:393-734(-)